MDLIPRKFYLDDIFDDFLSTGRETSGMKCDIYEKEGKYHIEMDVPGFDKKDIKLDCDNGYLTISAEKNLEQKDESKKYLRRERTYSKYQRSFYLGDADENNIDAEFTNGTLHIVIPKKDENAGKRYIEIK